MPISSTLPLPLLSPPRTIVPVITTQADLRAIATYATLTASGAMTATVYKAVVSVSGPGVLNLALCNCADGTARDIAMKVVLDGTQVVEVSAAAVALAGGGLVAAGWAAAPTSGVPSVQFDQLPFLNSMVVSIKSSLTETDKMNYGVYYRTV